MSKTHLTYYIINHLVDKFNPGTVLLCKFSMNGKHPAFLQGVRIVVLIQLSLKFNSHAGFKFENQFIIINCDFFNKPSDQLLIIFCDSACLCLKKMSHFINSFSEHFLFSILCYNCHLLFSQVVYFLCYNIILSISSIERFGQFSFPVGDLILLSLSSLTIPNMLSPPKYKSKISLTTSACSLLIT